MVALRYGVAINTVTGSDAGADSAVVLWSNPDPSITFAAQNIDLADSLAKYRRIRIATKRTISNDDDTAQWVEYNLAGGAYDYYDSATNMMRMGISMQGTTYLYFRELHIVDDQQLHFGACQRVNTSGTGNDYCVPLFVQGIK